MKPFNTVYYDGEYEVVEDYLNGLKKVLRIREWVTMDDVYIDERGDLYYVELYDTEYSREEGHGFHDVLQSSEPKEYILFLTVAELESLLANREEKDEEPSRFVWLLVLLGLVLLTWAFMWIAVP